MRYNTLRSDFLPTPAKLGDGNASKKKRWTPRGRGRGRWRSNLRSSTGNVRPKFSVGSLDRGKALSRGRIKVTVPNQLRGITRSRANVARASKPKYEFEKYLEALKYEESVKVPQQKVINDQREAESSSGNSKVTKKSDIKKIVGNKEESMDVDNDDASQSDREPETDSSEDRKIQLVKTTVTVPQNLESNKIAVRRNRKQASQQVFSTLKSDAYSRSNIQSRTGRVGRNVRGSDNQPSARLFLQSLPS